MFSNCSSLTTIDISGWDVGNVTDMYAMFYGCSSLTTLDISGWDVGNVTDMSYVFRDCSSLTTINISGWDVGNVTDMNAMFYNCSSLTTLDVSGWNVSNVTNMRNTFYNCSSLVSLDVSTWNVSNVTNMRNIVSNCSSLISLNLLNWDFTGAFKSGFLRNTDSLTSIAEYEPLYIKHVLNEDNETIYEIGKAQTFKLVLEGASIGTTTYTFGPYDGSYSSIEIIPTSETGDISELVAVFTAPSVLEAPAYYITATNVEGKTDKIIVNLRRAYAYLGVHLVT